MNLPLSLLWIVATAHAFGAPSAAAGVRIERTRIAGGAELITWIERLPDGSELPILSALNDTLWMSEPADNRLRQVWVFTYAPPSLGQRVQGAVPFLYHRLWRESGGGSTRPGPAFDMGAPSRGIWKRVALAALQAEVINPAGALARLTSRSYGGNLGEYKTTHVWEALDVLPPADTEVDGNDGNDPDAAPGKAAMRLLESRLQLNGRMFSGLVRDEALPDYYEKYQSGVTEVRGHNWELLRQTAEENGLYFQPLAIGGMVNSFAMVSVAREDLGCNAKESARRFDAQFLKIANPFGDRGLCDDTIGTNGATIPLAVYSLDYPGVPLLLVDFRRAAAPTRLEMTRRAADDVTTGVLGLTGFGLTHLGYRAVKSTWLFVHARHGNATNRAMRRRAFVQLRHALGVDATLDPALRADLSARVEKLDIDPLERTWAQEVRGARAQYAALLKYAEDPAGLPRMLAADRAQEARVMAHGAGARILLRAASISTFGLFHHDDHLTSGQLAQLAARRRQTFARNSAAAPDTSAVQAGE